MLSVLDALIHVCVGYMYSGMLGAHLVLEGSGPCKTLNVSHLLELRDMNFLLWDMYALTRNEVNCHTIKLR